MSISVSSELSLSPTVRLKMKNLLILSAFFVFFSYTFSLKSEERSVRKSSKSSSLEISDTEAGLIFRLSNSEGVGRTQNPIIFNILTSVFSLPQFCLVGWACGCHQVSLLLSWWSPVSRGRETPAGSGETWPS